MKLSAVVNTLERKLKHFYHFCNSYDTIITYCIIFVNIIMCHFKNSIIFIQTNVSYNNRKVSNVLYDNVLRKYYL